MNILNGNPMAVVKTGKSLSPALKPSHSLCSIASLSMCGPCQTSQSIACCCSYAAGSRNCVSNRRLSISSQAEFSSATGCAIRPCCQQCGSTCHQPRRNTKGSENSLQGLLPIMLAPYPPHASPGKQHKFTFSLAVLGQTDHPSMRCKRCWAWLSLVSILPIQNPRAAMKEEYRVDR